MFTFSAMPWYEHWRLIFSPTAASLQPSTYTPGASRRPFAAMPYAAAVSTTARSSDSTRPRMPQLQAGQVQQRVGHQLAGTVVGDLSPPVDFQDRDISGIEDVRRVTVESQRIDGGMLDEPDFIPGIRAAPGGEALHLLPDRREGATPEFARDKDIVHRVSLHRTPISRGGNGCARDGGPIIQTRG